MKDFVVGSVVRNEDFWFRDNFADDLWDSLRKHNILLLAPRRTGKTSVMYRLLDRPRAGWLVIHLNVEEVDSPAEFVIHLIDALREHQPAFLRDIVAKGWKQLNSFLGHIQSIEGFELKVELRKSEELRDWRQAAEQLLRRITAGDQTVLFIVDEFPDMLNNIRAHSAEEHEGLLHWFRRVREQSLEGKIRWLVGGSVNLFARLDQGGQNRLVNDLKIERMPCFTEEEVRIFVTEMLTIHEVPFDATVVQCIQELLGKPVAIFLQMFTQEIYRHWKRFRPETITAEIVREVFQKSLLGEIARDKFQHYRSRIALHYPDEEKQPALYLLDRLAAAPAGISRPTLLSLYCQVREFGGSQTSIALEQGFDRLLLDLQSDFYIEENDQGLYDYSNRLLKTWWRKYYGRDGAPDAR